MTVEREVVLDLLPLYVAGEASPASRALVEEYLKVDPGLAERIRVLSAEGFAPTLPTDLPPELELRSLRRTRRFLALERWLFGLGIALLVVPFGVRLDVENGRLTTFRFLVVDYPYSLGPVLALGAACWFAYFALRRKLRSARR